MAVRFRSLWPDEIDKEGIRNMANIKSQKKRILTDAKRAERNKSVRAEVKTRVKAAQAAAGTDGSTEALRLAIKRIDKAAQKGVMHKNAARKKSRLMKQLQSVD
jgi:small subunit ribosomal protein S20